MSKTIMIKLISHSKLESATEEIRDWLMYLGASVDTVIGSDFFQQQGFAIRLQDDEYQTQWLDEQGNVELNYQGAGVTCPRPVLNPGLEVLL